MTERVGRCLQPGRRGACPGSEVVDALELLSDEKRLAILLPFWDGYDPYAGTETMSFSEIPDRVGVRDSANFSYHLDRLTDHFVEKTADGYRLRNAGLVFVRTVVGAGLDTPEIRATELDMSCTRCAAARMELGYWDGTLYLTCPVCEGYERLVELENEWGSDNLFRLNQNIEPTV